MVGKQGGGAHVDEKLPGDYINAIEGLGFAFQMTDDDGKNLNPASKAINLHFASLRQMAYEVI